MSTIIIGGGGPHPNARIVQVSEMAAPSMQGITYEIRDGVEVLAVFAKLTHAQALLPFVISGE